jgi:hypothetical protein
MTGRRIAALAILAFGALFVAGSVVLGEIAGALGDPDPVFAEHYASGENRAGDIIGCSILVVASALFLVFVAAMRQDLHGGGIASDLFTLGGVAFVALWLVAVGLLMATPLAIIFGQGFDDTGQFDGGHASVLPQAGMVVLLVCALPMAALTIGSLAAASRSADVLPRWHGWVSLLCAVGLLFAFSYMTMPAMPLWCAATGIALLRARPALA